MENKYKKAGELLASLGISIPENYLQSKSECPGNAAPDKLEPERPAVKTIGEFVNLVERMRLAQTEFFKSNGSRVYLQKARELEKQVDACIAARRQRENQPELVPEGV